MKRRKRDSSGCRSRTMVNSDAGARKKRICCTYGRCGSRTNQFKKLNSGIILSGRLKRAGGASRSVWRVKMKKPCSGKRHLAPNQAKCMTCSNPQLAAFNWNACLLAAEQTRPGWF
jgi:hypothetical protein